MAGHVEIGYSLFEGGGAESTRRFTQTGDTEDAKSVAREVNGRRNSRETCSDDHCIGFENVRLSLQRLCHGNSFG
jgi:hypothetical protein